MLEIVIVIVIVVPIEPCPFRLGLRLRVGLRLRLGVGNQEGRERDAARYRPLNSGLNGPLRNVHRPVKLVPKEFGIGFLEMEKAIGVFEGLQRSPINEIGRNLDDEGLPSAAAQGDVEAVFSVVTRWLQLAAGDAFDLAAQGQVGPIE